MNPTDLVDWLQPQWESLLCAHPAPAARAGDVFRDLVARYREPGRFYHTLEHVEEVLQAVDTLAAGLPLSDAVHFAAWFHDAVYDTHAADNEERSAALAETVLPSLGVPAEVTGRVRELILLTKTHQADADDRAAAVLLDADLAILGADDGRYNEYARAIRQEYAWVPDEQFREGRARVLRSFLQRPRIYRTEQMFAARETPARRNLTRELSTLA